MSSIGKFLETEGRFMVIKGFGVGEQEVINECRILLRMLRLACN